MQTILSLWQQTVAEAEVTWIPASRTVAEIPVTTDEEVESMNAVRSNIFATPAIHYTYIVAPQ